MTNDEKSGQVFIAYRGNEFENSMIEHALTRICPSGYTVNCKAKDNVIFAKVVYDSYTEDRDPHWNSSKKVLSVNGYNQDEIERANRVFKDYGINDFDRYQRLTNFMYVDYSTYMFKKLSDYMHFCSVIYDRNSSSIIAGVTEPNDEYTHLYYGYTKQNKELMFSNDENILKEFCDEIIEMPENTYMKNGELYTLGGEKIEEGKNAPLIKKTRENANSLIDGLNTLLAQVTDEAIRARIEQNIEEYLVSGEPRQRVSNFISTVLAIETKNKF